nr:hypothetical protein BJQ95_01700 [Cryobacterium sp. SO1]
MTTVADRKGRVDHAAKVPRWALWVAHAVPLCVLPSEVWRLAMSIGIPVGFSDAVLREDYDLPGWGAVYTIGLAVALECLALLTLGLVYPWGEVVPRWIPFIGGKSVPRTAAVIPAGIGATLITMITFSQLAIWDTVDSISLPLMGPSYAPILAWGPLLAVVTVAYFIRRGKAAPPIA